MANKNKIECSLISHYKFVEVLHGGIVFIHIFLSLSLIIVTFNLYIE